MAKSILATPTRSQPATKVKDDRTLLKELLIDELRDIYWAEKYLTKTMPRLLKAATSPQLAHAFENHLMQSLDQITRLELAFEMMELHPRARKCEAMEGLVKECQQMLQDMPKGSSALDAGLIICVQKIEHYEIAAYGSLVQLAKTMGRKDVADILHLTLVEEKETDELLTELAVSGINLDAVHEEGQ
ncbi:ferritin-like domain-containing protein [Flavisolibacter tropicus]|uniref:YciE/YciF ferroxidase family protein n=1 Tax=Flavisolibacter tropicus TaxID=1492898 RepID=UPI000AF39CB2|nr:ferritin-like domain-containing protein [Flavisolibacter tropicus]